MVILVRNQEKAKGSDWPSCQRFSVTLETVDQLTFQATLPPSIAWLETAISLPSLSLMFTRAPSPMLVRTLSCSPQHRVTRVWQHAHLTHDAGTELLCLPIYTYNRRR